MRNFISHSCLFLAPQTLCRIQCPQDASHNGAQITAHVGNLNRSQIMARKSGGMRKEPRGAKRPEVEGKFAALVAKHAASVGSAEKRLAETVRAGVARALRGPRAVAGQAFETIARWRRSGRLAAIFFDPVT